MIRSLVLVALAVVAIISVAVWPSDRDAPAAPADRAAPAPSATTGPDRVVVCPPPVVQEGPGFLAPGLHERLVDTRATIVGDRAELGEFGVHIAAVRIDPVIGRVRVVVPGALPRAVDYLVQVIDAELVCLEVGGVLE